jgi:hypothetical protein
MVKESPFDCFRDWSSSIVLVLVIPNTDNRCDDEVADTLDECDVPKQSKEVEHQVVFLSVSDFQSHVRIGFVMLHCSCR